MVIRNAKRLERLSSDILDIARIESGNLNLHMYDLNLDDIILPVIRDLQSRTRPEVKINYSIDPNIRIIGDKERLTQVISNLLDNANKFTQSGTICIESDLDESCNQVIISVTDTGSGIDSDILPKLFNKFSTKSDKGTGLGLFISKNIVEAHGGKIWGENNKDNQGATFAFSLPITQRA